MLSIIIPCYNCSKTLKEAVDSIYETKPNFPFEIVMVDDCSTDSTKEVMTELKNTYPEIKTFFHDKNMGGGATRNTATKNSIYDLIFCLDSDDMVGPGMLQELVDYQNKTGCDGVGVSTSIKFKGGNKSKIAFVNNFGHVGERIPFEALLQKKGVLCSLYSTFLYTKKAFEIVGGYPTNHGFDTQGFAWRFLANGLNAHTCPDTKYLHRIDFHRSYYLREYDSGKVNHNWRKVYEEFLYLFSDDMKSKILNFDFNDPTKGLNVLVESSEKTFADDYQKYIIPNTKKVHASDLENTSEKSAFDLFWLGVYLRELGDEEKSTKLFREAIDKGMSFPVAYAYAGLPEKSGSFYKYTLQGSKVPFLKRFFRKIRRTLNI